MEKVSDSGDIGTAVKPRCPNGGEEAIFLHSCKLLAPDMCGWWLFEVPPMVVCKLEALQQQFPCHLGHTTPYDAKPDVSEPDSENRPPYDGGLDEDVEFGTPSTTAAEVQGDVNKKDVVFKVASPSLESAGGTSVPSHTTSSDSKLSLLRLHGADGLFQKGITCYSIDPAILYSVEAHKLSTTLAIVALPEPRCLNADPSRGCQATSAMGFLVGQKHAILSLVPITSSVDRALHVLEVRSRCLNGIAPTFCADQIAPPLPPFYSTTGQLADLLTPFAGEPPGATIQFLLQYSRVSCQHLVAALLDSYAVVLPQAPSVDAACPNYPERETAAAKATDCFRISTFCDNANAMMPNTNALRSSSGELKAAAAPQRLDEGYRWLSLSLTDLLSFANHVCDTVRLMAFDPSSVPLEALLQRPETSGDSSVSFGSLTPRNPGCSNGNNDSNDNFIWTPSWAKTSSVNLETDRRHDNPSSTGSVVCRNPTSHPLVQIQVLQYCGSLVDNGLKLSLDAVRNRYLQELFAPDQTNSPHATDRVTEISATAMRDFVAAVQDSWSCTSSLRISLDVSKLARLAMRVSFAKAGLTAPTTIKVSGALLSAAEILASLVPREQLCNWLEAEEEALRVDPTQMSRMLLTKASNWRSNFGLHVGEASWNEPVDSLLDAARLEVLGLFDDGTLALSQNSGVSVKIVKEILHSPNLLNGSKPLLGLVVPATPTPPVRRRNDTREGRSATASDVLIWLPHFTLPYQWQHRVKRMFQVKREWRQVEMEPYLATVRAVDATTPTVGELIASYLLPSSRQDSQKRPYYINRRVGID